MTLRLIELDHFDSWRQRLTAGTPRKARPRLGDTLRQHLGGPLQAHYASSVDEEPPERFLRLIAQLEASLAAKDGTTSYRFKDELLAALPDLRGFARSIVPDPNRADDLVQEAMLKAWQNQDRFQPGSNFKAWVFTILRNQFYTECRKSKREVEDADGVAAGRLIAQPDQFHKVALQDVWARLGKLPASQREALLLIAEQGMTYEEASEVLGCQTGTVKSRVSRARAYLAGAMGLDDAKAKRCPASA